MWYMNPERRADLAGSCALAALTLEAARADDSTRKAYDQQLRAIVSELQAGLDGKRREERALAILALLGGGLSMAHAVHDQELGARIARSVVEAIAMLDERGNSTI